jgi:hypothetical protein
MLGRKVRDWASIVYRSCVDVVWILERRCDDDVYFSNPVHGVCPGPGSTIDHSLTRLSRGLISGVNHGITEAVVTSLGSPFS